MDIKIAEWVKVLFVAALLWLAYIFLKAIMPILLLLVLAGIVVYLVEPVVQLLSRIIRNRTLAVLVSYLAFLVIAAAVIALAAPLLARELRSFGAGLPDYVQTAKDMVISLDKYLSSSSLGHFVELEPQAVIEQLGKQLSTQGGAAFQLVTSVIGLVGQAFLILVISLYVLILLPTFDRWVRKSSGPELERTYDNFVVFLGSAVNKYVKGMVTLLFAVGLFVGVGLWLIGVPNAFILGILAGMLEVVPYFGPLIAAIPIIIVAATVNWTTALLAIAVMLAAQLMENYLLSPFILGKSAEINPLAVLLLLLIGGELGGLFGLFLAVPVFIILRSIQRFIRDNLSYVSSSTGLDRIVLRETKAENR